MEEQREQSPLRVEEAMQPPPEPVLDGDETAWGALERVNSSTAEYLLVSLPNGEWSAVTKEGLRRQAKEGRGGLPLRSVVAGTRLPRLHPDQPLYVALRQIGDRPFLPVVHRADFHRLQGVVSLSDILTAYRAAFQTWRPLEMDIESESREASP